MAYQVRGVVTDTAGEPLPYVSVYIEHTTYGVATNPKGEYFLELDNGSYNIIFEFIGYETVNLPITVQGKNQVVDVVLKPSSISIDSISIVAEGEDPAYAIIRKAQDRRSFYLNQYYAYRCSTYIKATLDKEPLKEVKQAKKDSTVNWVEAYTSYPGEELEKEPKEPQQLTGKEKMNLIEVVSVTNFLQPNRLKEEIIAYRDLSEKTRSGVSISVTSGDPDISQSSTETNPHLFYTGVGEADFNFYENNMYIPVLGPRPFVSPISSGAMISYKYKMVESFFDDHGRQINKIQVIPKFKAGALFSGYIFIVENEWCIQAVDLTLPRESLNYFKHFRVVQEQSKVDPEHWMVTREEFFYNTRSGSEMIIGNTVAIHSDYDLQPEFPKRFFNNELRYTADDAYERDSFYWVSNRKVTLKEEEIEFIRIQDSITNYHNSEEYLDVQDSIYNRVKILDFLIYGVGFRNSFKKQTIYFNPIVFSARPWGVGGYRHSFGGYFEKEFRKGYDWRMFGDIDYGFANADVKGRVGTSFRYVPKKFARLFLTYGNAYTMLNSYESITSTFARGNYVQKEYYRVGHRIEVINGLFFRADADFADYKPIDLDLSGDIFKDIGDDSTVNDPEIFEPYTELKFSGRLSYTFGQKYYMEPYKKVIVGSKWPTIGFYWKGAFPGILGSRSNFDYVEVSLEQDLRLGKFGNSSIRGKAGRFLDDADVRITDVKYFRGSDRYFFSNPLNSFQLLGPTLNTNNEFFHVNYIHHFNGIFLNKLPLLQKLKLEEVAGAGYLYLKDGNFNHAEIFAGIELPFRIQKQLMKLGFFVVSADSNLTSFDTTFKVGINFFDSFTGSWMY